MKRLKDKTGTVVALELNADEMAKALGVRVEDLEMWTRSVPPASVDNGIFLYRVGSPKDVQLLKKRAALLRTRMTEEAVARVEAEGLLDAYSALAEDCPPGITAHVWRSYGLVVLMQVRYGKMLDAVELAERAGLQEEDPETGAMRPSVATATQHLRLLRGLGFLREGDQDWKGQWRHQGLPRAWRGMGAS
jgi:hypothetical protein